jgi:hypothetical protein
VCISVNLTHKLIEVVDIVDGRLLLLLPGFMGSSSMGLRGCNSLGGYISVGVSNGRMGRHGRWRLNKSQLTCI